MRTRKPSGIVPWPLILVEGEEKAGKSWMAAELSASDKIGRTLWVELGSEGTADQYGEIPGADYEIVEHNGTWPGLCEVIREAADIAQQAQDNGDLPVLLVIDTATAEWELLKAIAEQRARNSKYGKKLLESDPNAEIPVDRTHWTYVTDQHYEHFIEPLKRFPGIVVVTARGKEISATDANGKAVPNSKEYKVEGQKGLGYDCHAWIRLSRSGPPTVIGMRSVTHPVKAGSDQPIQDPNLTLERFVFDILGCDPKTAEPVKVTSSSELERAKSEVWKAAQDVGWDMETLASHFSSNNDGTTLASATVDQLDAMRDLLRMGVHQPEEAA